MPLSQLASSKKKKAKKPKAEVSVSDSDDDFIPLASLAKKAKAKSSSKSKKSRVKAERSKGKSKSSKKKRKRSSATSKKKSSASKKRVKKEKAALTVKIQAPLKLLEGAMKANKWWEKEELPEGMKWRTLEHNGLMFPPPYKPHGVKLLYDGKPVDLTRSKKSCDVLCQCGPRWSAARKSKNSQDLQ